MDRFRLLERIGSGGMGTVYRAYDERLEREVAVKEVADSDPRWVLREAQAAARLNHPGIVALYEFGERDETTLLVSELVDGRTLADLHRSEELCDREIGRIACNLSEALAHAHARGVVHRDIKPENVIVRDDVDGPQRAKLMDFGIARIAGAPTLTADGQVVGTLAYMSPEQAEGEVAGPESDVYSLAMTIYECLSGDNPVAAASPAATVRRIGLAPPLSDSRPDLPEGLTDAIDACLDPDPAERPTAAELADRIEDELDELEELPTVRGAANTRAVTLGTTVATLLAGAALVPLLGGLGAGAAASAFGAWGRSAPARAILGASIWFWMLGMSAPLGFDLELGIPALVSLESLIGAAVFAASAVVLGWVLSAGHASIALLGAMLWAAGLDAALGLVGNGDLGASPALLVFAGAVAVAIEFRLGRGEGIRAPGRWDRAPA